MRADDIAGIWESIRRRAFTRQTGSVSGKVTKNGIGVLGAHVVAFDREPGQLVGGFSLSDDGAS